MSMKSNVAFLFGFIFSILLTLGNFQPAICQKGLIDSLVKALNGTEDTKAKLGIFPALIKASSDSSFEKSLEYGKEGLKLAKSLNDKASEANINLSIAQAYSSKDQFDKAFEYCNNGLSISNSSNNYAGIAEALNLKGRFCMFMKKYSSADSLFDQALEVAISHGIKVEEGNSLYLKGSILREKKENLNAIRFFEKAIKTFDNIHDNNGLAKSNEGLGFIQSDAGDYKKALDYFEIAMKFRKLTKDNSGCAQLYNNIGNAFYRMGKYEKAILNYQDALKYYEAIGSQKNIGSCSINIGNLYESLIRGSIYKQNVYFHSNSLEYYEKAMKIYKAISNDMELAKVYNNIGNVYAQQAYEILSEKYGEEWETLGIDKQIILSKYSKSIDIYSKSLALRQKVGDKAEISSSLSNLGGIYTSVGDLPLALDYLERAYKLDLDLDNNYETANTLSNIGQIYFKLKNYNKALSNYIQSLKIAENNHLADLSKSLYENLSDVYLAIGDCNKSHAAYKKFVQLQDSFQNENSMNQIAEMQTKYETEKKVQQIDLLNKDAKLKDVEIKQKNTFIWFVVAGLLSVMAISLLLVKQNRDRKKTNTELNNKNELITVQKQEITDSIQYARRIQSAVLPVETVMNNLLPESFIFFKPRDIVSGDFYWINEKNDKIIVATADCTGHGVPGAFMSMLGTALLTNISATKDELHTDDLLNDLRLRIIESLHQTGKEGENKDGMDITLYILDINRMKLEFSGANNSLYIVRNGEMIEVKADRMPIGIHDKASIPFKKHEVVLEKGDMIYSSSDGYHDQFGGPNNKKFTSGKFKTLLTSLATEHIDKQSKFLEKTIFEWMGENAQVDDMLVIGVRV